MSALNNRRKISTTVSQKTLAYLVSLQKRGQATSLAEAVDIAVERARRAENRARLERDTAAYFARLPARAANEEKRLEKALTEMVDEVEFED